ncbi:MAG: phenylpropionate dioxygenase-like ring-hydroxylating dioxygenase large terminal subunit [Gammaproteobacteria bacterium]|jgi:phenylpropionate dioxygenase-like ring-hydroxylating dioxygenase large terminal subunit
MYINFWYPTCWGAELGESPLKTRILGQDLVVFRDTAGKAHCLSNTCIHRGGSLGDGKVKGDCLQCPYHGWEFNGDGNVTKIPSLGKDAKIPARARIDAYPVEERYGIVFAFLGDLPEAERPPILEIPTYAKEGWAVSEITYEVPIHYERSIENGLDPAHNEFVHPTHGFGGENAEYKVNDLRLIDEDYEWGFGFFSKFNSPEMKKQSVMSEFKKAKSDREAGSGNTGPNHLWTIIRFSEKAEFGQYMYEAPIDENNTKIYLINMRNMALEPEHDDEIVKRNWNVIQQDITVLNQLRPVITPESRTKEFMVPADKVILMYRDILKGWDAKGWRIDMAQVKRDTKRIAYAIPSPARRKQKGWVLDSIPLLPADADVSLAKAK